MNLNLCHFDFKKIKKRSLKQLSWQIQEGGNH